MLVSALGDLAFYKPVFCYGDTIYNPFNREITPDIEQHEMVHQKQQSGYSSTDMWYNMYITDSKFRLEQEIEAYGEQFLFAKNHGIRGTMLEWLKDKLARELSGGAYGNIISYGEAVSKIRHYGQ